MRIETENIEKFFDTPPHNRGVLGCDACDEIAAKEDALAVLTQTLRDSPAITSVMGKTLFFSSSHISLAQIGGGHVPELSGNIIAI